ncbi:molybdopterin-guanine dinucleotide biosynthesis protein MobB [Klebsiella pneumoniae]|uniref:molybdopterin-guanine dinucleotide biosynthesis protein MobB n=1 Tax=Klebsiella pneumoniae TaxID=573 RepID=UPI00398851B4
MIPLLAIAAWSGTGKTTSLWCLIPELYALALCPELIKHTHHDMDVNKHRMLSDIVHEAGAAGALAASR